MQGIHPGWAPLVAGFALLAPPAQQERPAPDFPANILVVVLDDLGVDKLDFYETTPPSCPDETCQEAPNCDPLPTGCAGPYPETPSLDQLRRGGVWFTRAYATPFCSSSRACIQTGRFAFRTGVGHLTSTVAIPGDYELPNAEVLLPELLREGFAPGPKPGLPYRCGAFGKWHLSTTLASDYGHPVENGYHRFVGEMGNVGNHYRYSQVHHTEGGVPTVVSVDGTVTSPPFTTETFGPSVTTRDALAWIHAQKKSFFAYVALHPPHAPVQVPPLELVAPRTRCELVCAGLEPGDFLAHGSDPPELVKLVYRAMVEAVDAEVGNLIDGLGPGLRANTMVFVIGDNGSPEFVVDQPPHVADHAKGKVYELGIRVPLIVSGPLVPTPPAEGWRSEALVSAVDLFATIADIAGAEPGRVVPPAELDSRSFLPVLLDPLSSGVRSTVFSQLYLPNGVVPLPPPSCFTLHRRSLSDGEFKYIRVQTGLSASPCGTPAYREEFYHLPTDPEETHDLYELGALTRRSRSTFLALRAEMDVLSGR